MFPEPYSETFVTPHSNKQSSIAFALLAVLAQKILRLVDVLRVGSAHGTQGGNDGLLATLHRNQ